MADPLPIFPAHRLHPDSVTPRVTRSTLSGGTSLTGGEDLIVTDGGGRIEVTYGEMPVDDPAVERLLTAWDAFAAGGAGVFLVPLVTLRTAPRPYSGRAPADVSSFGDNDATFPTVVGYRVRLIEASVVGAATLRATAITIRIARGSPIQGGEWFSVADRAHRIVRVLSRSGLDATVQIDPPLRDPLTGDEAVEFEWPVVRARLAPGASLIPDMAYGLHGDVGATFVEVV